jgi:hypothetical protein
MSWAGEAGARHDFFPNSYRFDTEEEAKAFIAQVSGAVGYFERFATNPKMPRQDRFLRSAIPKIELCAPRGKKRAVRAAIDRVNEGTKRK